jgi:peptidoglycan/LPS O-acetylase OafA/YrhL
MDGSLTPSDGWILVPPHIDSEKSLNPNYLKLLDHLSRVTTAGRVFIPQIDGLRFVAIFAVIAFHVRAICSYHFLASPDGSSIEGDLVNDAFSVGNYGVELFFTVSGFILSLPFARQWLCAGNPISLREYYIRRVTRIEPPYVIHLVLLFVACALVLRWMPVHTHLYQNPHWAHYSFQRILASLFYCNGFIYAWHPYPNIVLWSLEVEVQFYLLAPFLARIFQVTSGRQRRALLGLLILAGPLAVSKIFPYSYLSVFSLLGNFQYFLAGFLLADIYLLNQLGAKRNHLWDFVFPVALAGLVGLRHWFLLPTLVPWLIFVCCLAAFCGVFTARLLGSVWITTIGGMCYTIYMYHWLMISGIVRLTGHLRTHILWLDLLIHFGLMSVIITVVCVVPFVLFERPFMRRDWPTRVWAKIRRSKKPAVAG